MSQTAPVDEDDIESLAVINEIHLASFTEGDKDLENELAELFDKTARGYLKRMREALAEERSWSAEAHALKGASANLGASRLAAIAKKAEFAPPSEDQITLIEHALQDVQTFFAGRSP